MNRLNNIAAAHAALAVKVKTGAGWQSYDVARLQISVGQAYHEGQELKAALRWAKQNFSKTIICVNDTLQRHNLEFSGLSVEEAFRQSNDAGREWVERNLPLIRTIPEHEIIRWENWRSDSKFLAKLEQVEKLYDSDELIRQAIDNEISNFWHRITKRQSLSASYDFARFHQHSKAYLVEECAAFQLMFEKQEAADIYPGSTLIPCTLFKTGKAETAGKRFTRIIFKENDAEPISRSLNVPAHVNH